MASDDVRINEIRAFFEGWDLYTTVIEQNYMIHTEVLSYLVRRLTELGWSDLSILEVGCGDAHVVSEMGRFFTIERYCGIELSRMALDFAATKLEGKVQNLELIHGEMVEEIDRIQGKFDLIVAGYTIHHLDEEGKRALFASLKERLYSGGLLVVYDVVHRQEETREEYLDRAVRHFETDWTTFTAEQLKRVQDHVRQNDIPESWEGWRRIAQESGYKKLRFPYYDKNRLFGIMEFLD
jgi:SAM-dependent methyltransferase